MGDTWVIRGWHLGSPQVLYNILFFLFKYMVFIASWTQVIPTSYPRHTHVIPTSYPRILLRSQDRKNVEENRACPILLDVDPTTEKPRKLPKWHLRGTCVVVPVVPLTPRYLKKSGVDLAWTRRGSHGTMV